VCAFIVVSAVWMDVMQFACYLHDVCTRVLERIKSLDNDNLDATKASNYHLVISVLVPSHMTYQISILVFFFISSICYSSSGYWQ